MRTVIFPGRYENLAKIGDFIRQSAREAGLDNLAVYAVETAVDEACSNIIEHAYGAEDLGNIECTCDINDDGLTVILHDHGQAFQPDDVPEPDINAPLNKRQAHGLGLFFMHKWMDEVHFDFLPDHGGNVLVMVKRKAKKA
jgi:serine/threonine-protein kinase RsbW